MTIGIRKRKDGKIEVLDTSSKTENRILVVLTVEQAKTLVEVLIACLR